MEEGREHKDINVYDLLLKYMPFISAMCLVLEIFRIMFFYFFYHFDPIPYLSFTFVITQFAGDIGLMLVVFFFVYGAVLIKKIVDNEIPGNKATRWYFKIFRKFIVSSLFFGIPIAIFLDIMYGVYAVIINAMFMLFSPDTWAEIPVDNTSTKKDVDVAKETIKKIKNEEQLPEDPDEKNQLNSIQQQPLRILFMTFIVSFLIIAMISGYNKADQLSDVGYRSTEVIFENDTIKRFDPVEYYIGQTESHVFIWNSKMGAVRVIKMDDVKEIRSTSYFQPLLLKFGHKQKTGTQVKKEVPHAVTPIKVNHVTLKPDTIKRDTLGETQHSPRR